MTPIEMLRRARVLAIVRRPDVKQVGIELMHDLHAAGVRAIEFTLDQPDAISVIGICVAEAPDGMLVGGGTVTTVEQVDLLKSSGATFAVSPHLDVELQMAALDRDFLLIPGIATASEVAAARKLGLSAVKLFPAGPLGPPYLKALAVPFPDMDFLPAGGIAVDDIGDWLEAGATCVGLGAALTGPGVEFQALARALNQLTATQNPDVGPVRKNGEIRDEFLVGGEGTG